MRPALLPLCCLVLLAGCRSSAPPSRSQQDSASWAQPSARANSTAANFAFYVLNLSWSPEYCHSHPTAVECAQHATFILHGLWPENADGSYPEHCSNAPGPANPSKYSDVYPDPGLLPHEWSTHGTCSGLSADDYFSAARAAFHWVTIPPRLSGLTTQTSMAPDDILGLFTAANPSIPRSSLALSCGNNYLTAVEVCLDKNLHPTACGGLRSCRANSVRIPPP